MKYYSYILLLALVFLQCRHKTETTSIQFSEKPGVPSSIKKEHENLLNQIHKLTLLKDSTGPAATKLFNLMQHHFKEEEDFVLQHLSLLPLLANGKVPGQSKEIIDLSGKLKMQLPHLTMEHQLIKAYVDELKQVATHENLPGIIEFEKELQNHANIEEEVLFPTSILIGEYLKLKSI